MPEQKRSNSNDALPHKLIVDLGVVGHGLIGIGSGLVVVVGGEAVIGDGPTTRLMKRADIDRQLADFDPSADMIGSINSSEGVKTGQQAIQSLEAQKPKEYFQYDTAVELSTAMSLGVLAAFALSAMRKRFLGQPSH